MPGCRWAKRWLRELPSAFSHDPPVELERQLVDGTSQVGVQPELLFLREVVIGPSLLDTAWRFCPIITNAERKVASRDTTSVGHPELDVSEPLCVQADDDRMEAGNG